MPNEKKDPFLEHTKNLTDYLAGQNINICLNGIYKQKINNCVIEYKNEEELYKSCDLIIALGGDGTFHEALCGVADFENTTLGFIPCGSGNDFAKTFKPIKRPLKKLLGNIIGGKTTYIDYIQFAGGERCINIAGTGLDVEVLRTKLI